MPKRSLVRWVATSHTNYNDVWRIPAGTYCWCAGRRCWTTRKDFAALTNISSGNDYCIISMTLSLQSSTLSWSKRMMLWHRIARFSGGAAREVQKDLGLASEFSLRSISHLRMLSGVAVSAADIHVRRLGIRSALTLRTKTGSSRTSSDAHLQPNRGKLRSKRLIAAFFAPRDRHALRS